MYHLQFSLQEASPETFGYTLVSPQFRVSEDFVTTNHSNRGLQCRGLWSVLESVVVTHWKWGLKRSIFERKFTEKSLEDVVQNIWAQRKLYSTTSVCFFRRAQRQTVSSQRLNSVHCINMHFFFIREQTASCQWMKRLHKFGDFCRVSSVIRD